MHRLAILLVLSGLASVAPAQQSTAIMVDDVPLDAYLQALSEISPVAREGAQLYMDAFQARCGRPMRTIELRRAVGEGDGNPTLIAMIRAAGQRDKAALQRLAGTVTCPRG